MSFWTRLWLVNASVPHEPLVYLYWMLFPAIILNLYSTTSLDVAPLGTVSLPPDAFHPFKSPAI